MTVCAQDPYSYCSSTSCEYGSNVAVDGYYETCTTYNPVTRTWEDGPTRYVKTGTACGC